MRSVDPSSNLEQARRRIATQVRQLRTERRWTQGALAQKIGMSQARLSEVERGDGSFSAEQLLEVLRLFNVTLDVFTERGETDDELQNALARLGATHLRTVPEALPSARFGGVRAVVREILLSPRDARLVLALAPVVVDNVDSLSLDILHDELAGVGFPVRVPWLVENVHAALLLNGGAKGRAAAARWHRARTVLGDFLTRHPTPEPGTPVRVDHFDPGVRSEPTLAQVVEASSEISRRWGIISELQPADFADALRAAHVTG
jgi:transcriptional regulator with XRE-family HTH domain